MNHCRIGFSNLITVLFALLSTALMWAQAASPPAEITTIHVIADLIQVPVLALRVPFRPATGLNRADFVVRLDGGPAFYPSFVRLEGTEPLRLSILVEASPDQSEALSRGLDAAIQSWTPTLLRGSDRLSFYVYDCQLIRSLDQEPADLTAPREKIARSISLPIFEAAMKGGKKCKRPPLSDVLQVAIGQIPESRDWKVLLLVVNGEDEANSASFRRVRMLAAAQGVTVFALKYVKDDKFHASVYSNTEGVNVLVSSLGGVTMHSSFNDLGEVTKSMISLIRQRYILSFPRPGNGSAGAHRLEINTKAKGVKVVSSAASAPIFDSAQCAVKTNNWLCSEQRPQYGAQNPAR